MSGAGAPRVPRLVAVLLFLALLVTYSWFFQGGGWNQNSRFDLVRALVEDGSVDVGRFAHNTGDVSVVDGAVRSNKWPGLSFLAAPVYAAARGPVEQRWRSIPPPLRPSILLHIVIVATVALPGALLGLVVMRFAEGWGPGVGRDGPAGAVGGLGVALLFALGTLAFPWSTQFMAHQPAAVALFAAAAILVAERRRTGDGGEAAPRRGRLLAAGLLFGVAGAVLETSFLVIPIFLVYAWRLWGWRATGWICLGGVGPAIFLLGYHTVAFGGPFRTAHHHPNPQFAARESGKLLGQVGLPDPGVLLELTVLPRRGLFYYCPVLVFGLWGLVRGCLRRETRPEAVAFLVVFVALLLFNSSFIGWHGGWSTGARYLVPALPFLAAGLVLTPAFLRGPVLLTGGMSILLMTAITSVNVSVPQDPENLRLTRPPGSLVLEDVRDPIRNYILPRFARGELSVHRQHVDEGLPGQRFSGEDSEWASYNLGEAIGLPGLPSLLPLALLWAAFGAFAARSPGRGIAREGAGPA